MTEVILEWIIDNFKLRKSIHFDIIGNKIHIINYFGTSKIITCNQDHMIFNNQRFNYNDPNMLYDFKLYLYGYLKTNFIHPFGKF